MGWLHGDSLKELECGLATTRECTMKKPGFTHRSGVSAGLTLAASFPVHQLLPQWAFRGSTSGLTAHRGGAETIAKL